MNSDSYKIIISLSHHRIAFEYWQRDAENKLVPMPNMKWPAPLAFYCSPTGIEIGDVAIRAIHSGTSNAFDNYFDRLTEDETYLLGGQKKPIRYLLLDAIEFILTDFFKNVLFGSKGSLSDNRATMPITLVCESDIRPNERALLSDLFKGSGFNRFKIVEYNSFIESYVKTSLASSYFCDNVLVAWTEGDDLTFTIFDLKNGTECRYKNFEGLGIDPRLNYVKSLIWDRVKGQNPFLDYSTEEETISKAALDFLHCDVPLVNGTLIMSDGNAYHYSLTRIVVDNLQCEEGTTIRKKLEEFLKENDITDRKKTLLLLRGIAAGNAFFEKTICQGFVNTIKSDKKLRSNTMQQLIMDINPVIVQDSVSSTQIDIESTISPHDDIVVSTNDSQAKEQVPTKDPKRIKDLNRKWREVNAQSSAMARDGRICDAIDLLESFKANCNNILGSENLVTDISSKIDSLNSIDAQTKEPVDSSKVKSLEREWREIKASSKGKVRNGQSSDASKLLSDFIARITQIPGTEDIINSAKKELSSLNPVENVQLRERKLYEGEKLANIEELSHSDKGEQLIASGKLKEARDWYRTSGISSKAKILTVLIRAHKGVELRKSSLDDCKRTKNIVQIKRIISELQTYISLCNEVNYNCSEYKKLLSEYKKLIK